jgi:hypothetical protein
MDGKVARFDKDAWPNTRHQFLLGDNLAWAFNQNYQDFQRATPHWHRLLVLQQEKLRGDETKSIE